MPAVDQDAAVEQQLRWRLPACGERVVVDGAGADALGLQACPGPDRGLGHVLAATVADQPSNSSRPSSPSAPLSAIPIRIQES